MQFGRCFLPRPFLLAEVLVRKAPAPIIVETDDKGMVGVKEAAESLRTSSMKVAATKHASTSVL